MEDLSGLLDFVRISSGTSFRSCEPEIIELMRQIDIMIEEKAVQWHEQIMVLQNELQLRTKENDQLTKNLEESRNEVKTLQKQLANEKKKNNTQMTQYDAEIEKLKSELNKLKTKFKKNSTKKIKEGNIIENTTKDSVLSSSNKVDYQKDLSDETPNLLEKSVCSLSSCLQDTNKMLDRRVNELQLCRLQLESLYFENTILRSFLHQRGIINFLEREEEVITAFAEKEIKRENELKEKIQSRIDEFMSSSFD